MIYNRISLNKFKTIFTAIFILINTFSYCQQYNTEFKLKERLFTGGELGLQFGNVSNVKIAPNFGVELTENFDIGFGLNYLKYRLKNYNISTESYGFGFFAHYQVFDYYLAIAEYEYLNFNSFEYNQNFTYYNRYNINSLFIGIGYRQEFAPRASTIIKILWNINDTPQSPYSNPLFRVTLKIGI